MGHRPGRVALLTLLLTILSSGVVGCAGKKHSAEEIRDSYALQLVEGFWVGYKFIKGDRIDPVTKDVLDLRIEDGTRIIHADRAEILVSTELQTVSLRLHGVVGADPETGTIIELEGVTTDPEPIRIGTVNE